LLDGSVAIRKRKKNQRPPFGMPKGIVLLATPEGWRHSVLTADGGMVCGRLPGVAIDAGPAEARTAAAAIVAGLAHDFHGTNVEVTWNPTQDPQSWTGQVSLITHSKTAPDA
jgi:hypothetical protein